MNNLFPKALNNHYTGHPIAKWFLMAITLLTIVRSLIHMFAPDGGAESIATIPLSSFTANCAATVVLLMALWGLAQLLMSFMYVVVLWRYQELIPLMYVIVILEYAMRIFLMHIKPIHTLGTAPGYVGDYIMLPLAIVLLFFSLRHPHINSNKLKK